MIECLILILNAYFFFFYKLLFDQLNYNETERWFVILVIELNTISWAKVKMLTAISVIFFFFLENSKYIMSLQLIKFAYRYGIVSWIYFWYYSREDIE